MNQSIAIIGCGWLGQALAQVLNEKAIDVIATRQSEEGVKELQEQGIKAECLSLPLVTSNGLNSLNCPIMIIMIPPQIRRGKKDYPDKIRSLVRAAEHGQVERLILVNSTAIYDGLEGEVTESDVLNNDSNKVAILEQAESIVLESNIDAVSLRVSGLVGPERLPSNFFNASRALKDSAAPVNLVHQDDVIGCIIGFIEQPNLSGIFNINSHQQMTKRDFYQRAAKIAGKAPPIFDEIDQGCKKGKYINSDKVRTCLNYTFKHDDILRWLSEHV